MEQLKRFNIYNLILEVFLCFCVFHLYTADPSVGEGEEGDRHKEHEGVFRHFALRNRPMAALTCRVF